LYSLGQVVNLGVLMFACRLPSLRMLDRVTDDAVFRDNWCTFSRARTEMVVCSRQMTNVLAAIDREEIAALRPRMIKDLIRAKRLPTAYLAGHLMVVSDGTGIFSSHDAHCKQCLTQEHQDGSKTCMHNVLETKEFPQKIGPDPCNLLQLCGFGGGPSSPCRFWGIFLRVERRRHHWLS